MGHASPRGISRGLEQAFFAFLLDTVYQYVELHPCFWYVVRYRDSQHA